MKNVILPIMAFTLMVGTSCEKALDIKAPINTITSEDVFSNDAQAYNALTGMYSQLTLETTTWSNGYLSLVAAFSSDDLIENVPESNMEYINRNKVSTEVSGAINLIWNSAYKSIYNANAIIEGVMNEGSSGMTNAAKEDILGQAYALRAFAYFYLVNLFERIPLVLTIDYNKVLAARNSNKNDIYNQIVTDLENAERLLKKTYDGDNASRMYISKWFVKGLMARVYLYLKDYTKAYSYASELISETTLFKLEADLNNVFTTSSQEVILRFDFNNASVTQRNATGEGANIGLTSLTNELLNSFPDNDKRKINWVSENTYAFTFGYGPAKYKIHRLNSVVNGPENEQGVAMRMGEIYLIRAEAAARLNGSHKATAIEDVNAIKFRAGIDLIDGTISDEALMNEIMLERRRELFCEWGHRWLDLKRTGRAREALSSYPYKMPWDDNQLLYPIPLFELNWNNNLIQNPGY